VCRDKALKIAITCEIARSCDKSGATKAHVVRIESGIRR